MDRIESQQNLNGGIALFANCRVFVSRAMKKRSCHIFGQAGESYEKTQQPTPPLALIFRLFL
jgi:hypothetical protein